VDAEGPKETADVVPDCLGAQVELGGDLLRRAALRQQTKHLDPTGGEMRMRRCGTVVRASLEQAETPTTRSPFISGTALISTATGVPPVETKTPVAAVDEAVPSTFRENSSRARRLSSGATTEVNWRPRTSPTRRSAAAAHFQAAAITEVWPIRAGDERRGLRVAGPYEWFRVPVRLPASIPTFGT
jgi:hypothetical protein